MELYGEALYHLGLGVMGAAAALGVLFAVVFFISGRKLKKILDQEYGEKRRR